MHCPPEARLQRTVQVKGDGDEWEQEGLRGCSATRPEAADFGRTLPVHAKGLAKIGEVGEAVDRQIFSSPASAGMQTRPSRRVLRFYEFGVTPREKGTHTRPIPRVP